MIQEEFKDLIFKFARHASVKGVACIFLFGSVAKGDADRRSDVDLLIVLDTYSSNYEEMDVKAKISQLALTLEKEYDRRIQVIFTNKNYDGLDGYFIENVLKEGTLLYSNSPYVRIKGLDAEPYSMILYSLGNLNPREKMKVKRLIHGNRTRKTLKGKVYENEKIGLVQQLQGIRIGAGAIGIPQKSVKIVEDELTKLSVTYKKIDILMTRDGIRKLKS